MNEHWVEIVVLLAMWGGALLQYYLMRQCAKVKAEVEAEIARNSRLVAEMKACSADMAEGAALLTYGAFDEAIEVFRRHCKVTVRELPR